MILAVRACIALSSTTSRTRQTHRTPEPWVRVTLLLAPILVSLGFFLSVLSPKAERPNGLINLIYLAAVLLAVGVVTLGIGLFQA
jgi:hypothetical protein